MYLYNLTLGRPGGIQVFPELGSVSAHLHTLRATVVTHAHSGNVEEPKLLCYADRHLRQLFRAQDTGDCCVSRECPGATEA